MRSPISNGMEEIFMNSTYRPAPVDTSNIILPLELEELTELLAKNVHEVWAQGRIAQGWTFATERNDTLKQTPCLVPYEDLSNEEKIFDQQTATQTIKTIIKFGFRISR